MPKPKSASVLPAGMGNKREKLRESGVTNLSLAFFSFHFSLEKGDSRFFRENPYLLLSRYMIYWLAGYLHGGHI